jgi:predicted nucleic acid-binding protein
MIGLDTNVLSRYHVAGSDAPSQQQSAAARKLLESAKQPFVNKSVVLELEWVRRGYYKSWPQDVLTVLKHLLAIPHLDIEDRVEVELDTTALADGFDCVDALHHASARHCTNLATFDDKKFARLAGLKGWNPAVKLLAA